MSAHPKLDRLAGAVAGLHELAMEAALEATSKRTEAFDALCDVYNRAEDLQDAVQRAETRYGIFKLRRGVEHRPEYGEEAYIAWQVFDREDVEAERQRIRDLPNTTPPGSIEATAITMCDWVRPMTPPSSVSPTGRIFHRAPTVQVSRTRVLVKQYSNRDT